MRKYITLFGCLILAVYLCACKTTNPTIQQKPLTTSSQQVQQPQAEEGMSFNELVARYSAWKQSGKPIRQALIDLPHILRVYAIDHYHTMVVFEQGKMTGFVTNQAWRDLVALAQAYGGKLIERSTQKDPITGKIQPITAPVKFWEEGEKIMYNDPFEPESKPYVFSLTETNLDWQGGDLHVANIIYRTIVHPPRIDAVIFSHPKPQPFVYKTPYLPEPSRITQLPPDGKIEDKEPIFAKHFNTVGKKLGFIFKSLVSRETSYTNREILQYITALCRNNGGMCQWVIPKHNSPLVDTLTQVKPQEAWMYILAGYHSPVRNHTWYMGCNGNVKFAVKGQQHNMRGEPGRWYYVFYLYNNKTLEGLDFVPLSSGQRVYSQKPQKPSPTAFSWLHRNPIAEQIALQTARTETPVTRTIGPTLYEGSYTGLSTGGCKLVSVFRIADMSAPPGKRQTDIYNYKICNGELTRLGITPPQKLSDTLMSSLPAIARKCQRYGQTQITTSNYQVYCRALRGESQCRVEISVLKDEQLVRKFIYDGCTGQKLQ